MSRHVVGYETVEEPRGDGDVFRADGSIVQRVEYSIRVQRKLIDAGGGETIRSGVDSIDGSITFSDRAARQFVVSLEIFTLHLADGRWLDFQVRDERGGFIAKSALREVR